METHTNTEITNTEAKPNKRSFEEWTGSQCPGGVE